MSRNDICFLEELYALIQLRKLDCPESSYTAKLFLKGRQKIAQKVGEEAVETVIDAVMGSRKKTIQESADLMFHLMVLWADMDIAPKDVVKELRKRHEEKQTPPPSLTPTTEIQTQTTEIQTPTSDI